LISYCYLFKKLNHKNQQQQGYNSNSLIISNPKPCPNPNCIRCQKYKQIQQNAQRKLPFMINYYNKKRKNGKVKTRKEIENINTDTSNDKTTITKRIDVKQSELQRVFDGVLYSKTIGEGTNTNTTTTASASLFQKLWKWWNLQEGNGPTNSKNINTRTINGAIKPTSTAAYEKEIGQNPTVLYVPNLQTQPIVTHLHSSKCDALLKIPSLRDIMLQEYITSQINAEWMTNDTGTLSFQTYNVKPNNSPTENNKNKRTSYDDSDHHSWQVLYLMNQGQWIHENIHHCPQTYKIIKNVQGLLDGCIFGNVFFSVLYPNTVIEAHCGPTNIRHRLHYSLSIPVPFSIKRSNHCSMDQNHPTKGTEQQQEPPCQEAVLRVREKEIKWEEGKVFVFDDSIVHEAVYPVDNNESEVRVVLIVDVWHPDLSVDEKELIQHLYHPLTNNPKY